MKHILLGFIAVLSLMLVPLILMHKGKGGGFSNFAESLTGSAGSSGVAEKNLNRWTVVAAVSGSFSSSLTEFWSNSPDLILERESRWFRIKNITNCYMRRADWAVTPSSCPVTLSVENRI